MDNKVTSSKENAGKYLSASDIVNGTANLFEIKEKEMESALKDIYREIGYSEID